jgi:hypothetical protein
MVRGGGRAFVGEVPAGRNRNPGRKAGITLSRIG